MFIKIKLKEYKELIEKARMLKAIEDYVKDRDGYVDLKMIRVLAGCQGEIEVLDIE